MRARITIAKPAGVGGDSAPAVWKKAMAGGRRVDIGLWPDCITKWPQPGSLVPRGSHQAVETLNRIGRIA